MQNEQLDALYGERDMDPLTTKVRYKVNDVSYVATLTYRPVDDWRRCDGRQCGYWETIVRVKGEKHQLCREETPSLERALQSLPSLTRMYAHFKTMA